MNDLVVSAAAAALRLQNSLLHGGARQRDGEHRGAVAGTLKPDGSALYVYGEITGYYLHWLGSMPPTTAGVPAAATAALDWLQRYLHGSELPLTRVYLHANPPDWRNDALFAFDLAMIAGGMACIGNRGIAALPPVLLADLQRWLQLFTRNDGLAVCLPRTPDAVLPQRWSTCGGPFTAKSASRILLLAQQAPLDAALVQACRRELQRIATDVSCHRIDMVHPTLYAIEGCLLCADSDPQVLARWFEQVVTLQGADGSLPESLPTPDIRRSDIVAQALRVAIFIEHQLQQPGRYRSACDGFVRVLTQRVRADGTLPFSNDANPDANVWGAMFAEQALRLYVAHLQQQPLPFSAGELV